MAVLFPESQQDVILKTITNTITRLSICLIVLFLTGSFFEMVVLAEPLGICEV